MRWRRSSSAVCCARSPRAASTTSATTSCARWSIATSAARGAGCCISRWPKRWNAAAKARRTNATPSWPSTSSARRSGRRRCTTWCSPANDRRRCSRCATRCTGWTVRSRCAESHPESLDERQRLALYERRGAARAQAGQTQGAVADIRRVVDAARAGGDRERTRDALVQLGMAYRRADAYEEATACLTEALAESRAMNDERHAADTLYHLGHGRVEHRAERPGHRLPPAGGRDLRAHGLRRSGRGAGLPRPRRGAFRERRARGGDRVLHPFAGAGPRHRRQELRVREPDDDRARLRRHQGARRLPARNGELRGGARDRARRRPAVAHWADAARARPRARLHGPLRRGVVRHARRPCAGSRASGRCATSSSPTISSATCCSTSA